MLAVPPPLVAFAAVRRYWNDVEEGIEVMTNAPLKLESVTPEMVTV